MTGHTNEERNTGRQAIESCSLTPCRADPLFSSRLHPILNSRKKKTNKKREKTERAQAGNEHERARSEAASRERAHPNPRSSSRSSSLLAALPCRRLRRPCEQRARNSSPAGPNSVPPIPDCSPAPQRSAQFLLFLGFDSVPPGPPSSSPEIQAARARWSSVGQGSCLHCSRV